MKTLMVLGTVTVGLSLGPLTVEAQKGKPTSGIRVRAMFDTTFVQPNGEHTGTGAGILGDVDPDGDLVGQYFGTVQPDGGFILDSTPRPVVFRDGIFNFVVNPALKPSTNGSEIFMNAHNVGKVTPSVPVLAGQFGLSWTDGGRSYSLQFGDAYIDPPNYAHVQCDSPVGGVCSGWTVSSLEASDVPTGTSSTAPLRHTGPMARLTVRLKGGTILGIDAVPFSLKLTRVP